MHHGKIARTPLAVAATLGLLCALFAGAAGADGDKLDEAKASTAKAISLLKEAPAAPAGREAHRKKAIDLLMRAHGEILKAKGE